MLGAVAVALVVFFLGLYPLRGFRFPVGSDAPVYLWWSRLAARQGLSAVGARSGLPALALMLSSVLHVPLMQVLGGLGAALGTGVGLAAAALVRAGIRGWDPSRSPTVASALAVQLAQLGCGNVLLADANFADPQLHRRFIISGDTSLLSVLAGEDLAVPRAGQSGTPGLTVLPAGEGFEHSLLLLNHDSVKTLLQKTSSNFDWVILDAGSVSDGIVATLAQFVDVRILVVDSQRTRHQVIGEALRQLNLDPRDLLGVVLNKQRRYIPDFLYRRF